MAEGPLIGFQTVLFRTLSVFVKPYLKFKVGDSLFGLSNFPRVVMFDLGNFVVL